MDESAPALLSDMFWNKRGKVDSYRLLEIVAKVNDMIMRKMETSLRPLSKANCKDCYGRGIMKLNGKKSPCSCVLKRHLKKYAEILTEIDNHVFGKMKKTHSNLFFVALDAVWGLNLTKNVELYNPYMEMRDKMMSRIEIE